MLDVNIQSYWILAFECWCYIRNLLVTIIEHQTRQLFIVWCTSPTSCEETWSAPRHRHRVGVTAVQTRGRPSCAPAATTFRSPLLAA